MAYRTRLVVVAVVVVVVAACAAWQVQRMVDGGRGGGGGGGGGGGVRYGHSGADWAWPAPERAWVMRLIDEAGVSVAQNVEAMEEGAESEAEAVRALSWVTARGVTAETSQALRVAGERLSARLEEEQGEGEGVGEGVEMGAEARALAALVTWERVEPGRVSDEVLRASGDRLAAAMRAGDKAGEAGQARGPLSADEAAGAWVLAMLASVRPDSGYAAAAESALRRSSVALEGVGGVGPGAREGSADAAAVGPHVEPRAVLAAAILLEHASGSRRDEMEEALAPLVIRGSRLLMARTLAPDAPDQPPATAPGSDEQPAARAARVEALLAALRTLRAPEHIHLRRRIVGAVRHEVTAILEAHESSRDDDGGATDPRHTLDAWAAAVILPPLIQYEQQFLTTTRADDDEPTP